MLSSILSNQILLILILIILVFLGTGIMFTIGFLVGVRRRGGIRLVVDGQAIGVSRPVMSLPPPLPQINGSASLSNNHVDYQSSIYNLSTTRREEIDPTYEPDEKPRNRRWPLIGLTIVILLIVGFAAWYGMNYTNAKNQLFHISASTITNAPSSGVQREIDQARTALLNNASATDIDTSGWQKYNNTSFGYSLQYPTNWKISPYLKDWNITPIPSGPDALVRITPTSAVATTAPVANNQDYITSLLQADSASKSPSPSPDPTATSNNANSATPTPSVSPAATNANAGRISPSPTVATTPTPSATPTANSTNTYVQIRVLDNAGSLEAGAFSSIKGVHNESKIVSRVAMPLYGYPSVKFVTDDGKEHVETSYIPVNKLMYVIELHAPSGVSLDDVVYRTALKLIEVLKIGS